MNKVVKRLSLLTVIIAAVAFGMFLSSGLNIMKLSNGDPAEGNLYMEGDSNARPVSFAKLAKIANPTVVNITATTKGERRQAGRNDIFDYFFGRGMERDGGPQRGFGSGFLISDDGYILTNYHVVSNKRSKIADDIEVKLYTDETFKAKIIGTDSLYDVALIKIDAKKKLPFLKLGDSELMEVGEWVMAIGNPSLLEHTVTVGVVSAQGRQLSGAVYRKFIQTDAAINQGNSGGPLINTRGEAIGINNMIIAGTEGIGFAIPINQVKDIIPDLKEKGYVQRGYIGILPEEITPDLKKTLNLPTDEGIFVQNVTRGGAADKAGLQDGDIIIRFNDKPIKDLEDLYRVVANSEPGKETKVELYRNNKKMTLDITPLERPSDERPASSQRNENEKFDENLGITVSPLSLRMKRYYRVPDDLTGVLVTQVSRFSPAFDAGLREDMIISRVNRKDIANIREFYAELEDALEDADVVAFYVSFYSGGEWVSRYVTVRIPE